MSLGSGHDPVTRRDFSKINPNPVPSNHENELPPHGPRRHLRRGAVSPTLLNPAMTGTTLYDIDSSRGVLLLQDRPNNGTLNTVGPLGVDFTSLTALGQLAE